MLITGGAGFLGVHLGRWLAEMGYEVALCDNFFRGKADQTFQDLCRLPSVRFIEVDLSKREEFKKLEGPYDHVVHLAAINGTRYFYEIPHEVLRVNILTTMYLLEWAATRRACHVLFASSSEVYAGTVRAFGVKVPTAEDVPLCVDDLTNPRVSYGASKILGELLCIYFAKAHGFRSTILRYHNVYGPRMSTDHVVPEFCLRVLRREDPFPIYGANQTRAFCYVDDAVRATQMIMESSTPSGEIVHVGNDSEEVTISALAEMLFEIADFHPKVSILPPPAGSVERRCPDITKLRRTTGYEPKIGLEEGLRATFGWYRDFGT